MHTDDDLEIAFFLAVSTGVMRRLFEELMGMSLEEWDERNYARIMAAGGD